MSMQKTIVSSLLLLSVFFSENLLAQSFWNMTPPDVRNRINRNILAIEAEKPQVHKVQEIKTDTGETLRIFTPNDSENLPIILLMHGGGWVGGNLETHDYMARYISKEVNALVFLIDFVNSPEGKFPQALEQCYNALLWICAHAKEFHTNGCLLAVVGDSAGGNLAAALCLMARDRRGPAINLQVLINPYLDLVKGLYSKDEDYDQLRWFAAQYVKDPEDVCHPYASPLKADLANLPRACILAAEEDELFEDGQKYAELLRGAKVPVNFYTQWKIGHLAGKGARACLEARESLDVAAAALRGEFFRLSQEKCKTSP